MGIATRVKNLQELSKSSKMQQQIWDSYARLCSPDEMGAIYKVLFLGEKTAGEVYPFLSEETIRKQNDYYS
jgi:SAM-dependent MidA family methyltransferase